MKNKLWGYPHVVQHFMEKVLPVLQMVEEQRKANPPLDISQTTASEISVSSSIQDAHVEMPELIDSNTGHRLKGGHNIVPASSAMPDRKSTLLISTTCLGSGVDDQDIARGSSSSASEEVSPQGGAEGGCSRGQTGGVS